MHKRSEEQEKADRREVRWALALLVAAGALVVAVVLAAVFDVRPLPDMSDGSIKLEDIAIDVGKDQAAARAAAKTEQKGD